MNLKNRIVSGLLAAGMVLSMSACSKNYEWVAKSGESQMGPGVYMGFLLNSYLNAMGETEDKETPILKQKIEDKDASEWITSQADELVKEYFAIEKQFDELGLTLTADDQKNIDAAAANYWQYQSKLYEDNGMSQESLTAMVTNSFKQQKLFGKLYDKGGLEEVSDEELFGEFEKSYVWATVYPISMKDSENKDLSDEKKAEVRKRMNDMVEKARKGEDFYDLILEDEKAQAGENADKVHEHTGKEHDSIFNKDDAAQLPEGFYTELERLKDGEYAFIENKDFMIAVQRHAFTKDGDEFKLYRNELISRTRSDDFLKKLQDWASKTEVTYADGALDEFTPKKVKAPEMPKQA